MNNEQENSLATSTSNSDMSKWDVNDGGEKIITKRMSGRFRNLKWFNMSIWLVFFWVPYLRWDGAQAVLLDIPNRQFTFFSHSFFPQDIWLLALVLVFFAILLAVVTNFAGRVFCGYFCFQTVWTDIYTFIETKLEGNTYQKRADFNKASMSVKKMFKRLIKHSLWIAIALLTGLSFTAWFTDVYQLWHDYLMLQAPLPAWITLIVFSVFTYIFAGFMREQVCFWLCPYARLQGVMYDQNTILPTYDNDRGEPRSKLKRESNTAKSGSCIDCNLCVTVCPTGIDIRDGQQEGCITCGLCIDACDQVMDKIGQPKGLIRYASYTEINNKVSVQPFYKRIKFVLYSFVILLILVAIDYGIRHLPETEFHVVHEHQPLYVRLSDGSIRNKYILKFLNKTENAIDVKFSVSGLEDMISSGMDDVMTVAPRKTIYFTAFIRVNDTQKNTKVYPIYFTSQIQGRQGGQNNYQSVFFVP